MEVSNKLKDEGNELYKVGKIEEAAHRWLKSHQNPQKPTKTTKNPKNCFLVFLVDGLFVCTPKTPKPPISPKYAGHVMCVMLMYLSTPKPPKKLLISGCRKVSGQHLFDVRPSANVKLTVVLFPFPTR